MRCPFGEINLGGMARNARTEKNIASTHNCEMVGALAINRITICKAFGYTMVCLGSKYMYVQRDSKYMYVQYVPSPTTPLSLVSGVVGEGCPCGQWGKYSNFLAVRCHRNV